MAKSKHASAAEVIAELRASMENSPEVVISVGPAGVTSVKANTVTEEVGCASVSLYHKILPTIRKFDDVLAER